MILRKTSTSVPLTTLKFLCGSSQTGKLLKRWDYQTVLPVCWETCMLVKEQQLEAFTWNKLTDSKLRRAYDKAVYCHPVYLTYMQSTSCEMLAGWVISWNQDCGEKYQQPQKFRRYCFNDRKWRGTKEPLDEGARGEWKSQFKTQY